MNNKHGLSPILKSLKLSIVPPEFPEFLKTVFWLFLLGLCATQIVFAEPNKTPVPPTRRTLIDRDPCSIPRFYYCTELRDVKIGQYMLEIPHNMIGQWPPENNFIELLPRWPGLKGAIKDEKKNTNIDAFDLIHIIINTIRPERPTEEGIRDLVKRLNLSSPVPLNELGLSEYTDPRNAKWKYYSPLEQQSFLLKSQPLFIQCNLGPYSVISRFIPDASKGGRDGTISCHYGFTLREGLYVSVEFYRRHIKDWKEIVSSVNTKVESFIQE